jgi:hypothetical protein
MKGGMQTYFFLASYGFRIKVLVLVIDKKVRETRSGSVKKGLPDRRGDYRLCMASLQLPKIFFGEFIA